MAITTVDGMIAGMKPGEFFFKPVATSLTAVGRPFGFHYLANALPGPATTGGAYGLSGVALTSWTGQIPIPAAATNTYLARYTACSTATSGTLLLCDRLWHNTIVNTQTTAQTISSVTWPARDADGTTAGRGVYIGVETSVVNSTNAPSLSMTYTNSVGTTGRASSNTIATTAASPVGSFYPMSLQAGDQGVQSVQSFTLSATWTTGTTHLVAYRVIAMLDLSLAGVPEALDAFSAGLPRIYDNSCLFTLYIPQATTATQIYGHVVCTQG